MNSLSKLIIAGLLLFSVNYLEAQTIEDGRRLTRNEQYEDADKLFNDMIAKAPTKGEIYYWAGINLLESGDSAAAAQMFEKGLVNSPKYTMNQVGKGHLLLRSNKQAEADAAFLLALKAKKKLRPLVNREIARAYLMVTDRSKSTMLANANKALEYLKLGPEGDYEVKLLEGDAMVVTSPSDLTAAITKYIESGYINTESPLPLLREAKVYQRVKNFDISMIRVDEALAKDVDFAPGYRQKAELFADMLKRDSAVIFYKEYLKRNNNLSARRKYVNALFFNQQYNDAIDEAKNLLAIKTYPNLFGVIAYAIVEKNDTSRAVNQEGLMYFQKYEETYLKGIGREMSASEKFYKGTLLYRNGDKDAAWSLQKQALEDTAQAQLRWYDKAREQYYSGKQFDRVIEVLNLKGKKNKGINSSDLYYMAMAYRYVEQYTKSNDVFKEIITKDSTYTRGYYYIALNWHVMDNRDSTGEVSKAYLKWLSRLSPEDKTKYKRDMQGAYNSLGAFADQKAGIMYSNAEDKKNGYPKTLELYNQALGYYRQLQELDPEDEANNEYITKLDKFVKSLEARQKKKR